MKSQLILALQIGTEFLGCVFAGVIIGHLLESYVLGLSWGMPVGMVLGFSVWVLRLVQVQKQLKK